MVWAKVDDRLHSSAKWRAASKGARALWATALSWCADQETDGKVPTNMLAVLDGTTVEARSLVAAGLWVTVQGGWEFKNWAEYQPTREKLEEKRARERERIANARATRRGVGGNTEATHRQVGDMYALPVPSRPDPTPDNQDRYNNPPEVDARAEDDIDPVLASVVEACRGMGVELHPLCAGDVVGFIDSRRNRRAAPPKVPTRYYPDAIRNSWPEVSKFIYAEGLVA